MNEWFSFLQIDSPEKIDVLNKIVTTFQIDIVNYPTTKDGWASSVNAPTNVSN